MAEISDGLGGRKISLSLSKVHMAFPALFRARNKKGRWRTISLAIMGRQFLGGLCLQPPYSAAIFVAGACAITDTYVRRLKPVLKETLPSRSANSVWSLPMPTPSPG